MNNLDPILEGQISCHYRQHRIRQAQQAKLAYDVQVAGRRSNTTSPLRTILITLINRATR